MSLPVILNSGHYTIRNVSHGAIRDDDGALGAKGTSSSPEIIWQVTANPDSTYTLKPKGSNDAASPGSAVSETKQRFHISVETAQAAPSTWRLQPVIIGSDPRILFAIYEPNKKGHWELNNGDKKEPVKLNREPSDSENQHVPPHFGPQALWVLQHAD